MDRIPLPRPTQHHTVSQSTTHLPEVSKRKPDAEIGQADESTIRWKGAAATPISFWWLLLPLSLLALGIYTQWGSESFEHIQSPAIGKPAPRLDLVRLADTPSLDRLEHVPAGKVSLVHFWGTWCGPCMMEYPALNSMAKKHENRHEFQFVSVSCEGSQNETFRGLMQETLHYFDSQEIQSFAFADPRGITRRSAAERLEQNALYYPTSLVIDSDGKIAGVWQGYTPEAVHQMDDLISELLSVSSNSIED